MRWYSEEDWDNLADLRDRIHEIDIRILELVKERMTFCLDVGVIKAANEMPVYDPAQEEKVIASRTECGKALGIEGDFIRNLMILLMDYSKKLQNQRGISYN